MSIRQNTALLVWQEGSRAANIVLLSFHKVVGVRKQWGRGPAVVARPSRVWWDSCSRAYAVSCRKGKTS